MNRPKLKFSFQNVGTLVALVISSLALFVSIYEANLLKDQQHAVVWPYVTVASNFNASGFSFIAENNGTGPAIIESVEVKYDGQIFDNWLALVKHIDLEASIDYGNTKVNRFNKTVLPANKSVQLLHFSWNEETRELAKSLYKTKFTVGYSSIMGEQWTFRSGVAMPKQEAFKAQVEFE
ncbi:MAG: hypothetical protein AAF740_04625 [Bacteroidota bacterium]